MAQDDLPDDVRKLIGDHIVSVEQLEILLLLRTRPEIEWNAAMVSEEARTSERSASGRLADLQARGFLSVRHDPGAALYRYQPSEGLDHAVEHLAKCYAERRFSVIDLIFSKPIEHLKVYANAFRLRKDRSDG